MTDKQNKLANTVTPSIVVDREYAEFVDKLKSFISSAQNHAIKVVNSTLVELYWTIGAEILVKQQEAGWGDDVIGKIAKDLKSEGLGKGFSSRNLIYMRQFARIWPELQFTQPVVAQISWSHNVRLMDACSAKPATYLWYVDQCIKGNWSKRVLETQIALKLHERQGKSINNFTQALEPNEADQASELLKDSYVFDFLKLEERVKERDLEDALLNDIQKVLIELGTGFAFYGRQKAISIGDDEYFMDLVFYHHVLRRFVILELKTGVFKPEYAGKMNFYLNAVDALWRVEGDRDSVGIILCADPKNATATFSLDRIQSPIAISSWQAKKTNDPVELEAYEELELVKNKLLERIRSRRIELQKPGGESV